MASDAGRYWRGISTREQAEQIVRTTAWGWVIFTGGALTLVLFEFLSGGYPRNVNLAAITLILFVPAIFLLTMRSVIAAWILFGISAFALVGGTGAVVMAFAAPKDGLNPVALLVLPAFWLFVFIATWRARKAAEFLSLANWRERKAAELVYLFAQLIARQSSRANPENGASHIE